MAISSLLTPETLNKLLRYDPEEGVLIWRERGEGYYSHAERPDQCAKAFNSQHAGRVVRASKKGYGQLHIVSNGKEHNLLVHRVIWAMHHGYWPKEYIDHIDGNPSNNRIENLRDVPMAVNLRNRRKAKSNTSGHNGVVWCPRLKLWKASASRNGKSVYLGSYEDKEQAAFAARIARKVLGFTERHGI